MDGWEDPYGRDGTSNTQSWFKTPKIVPNCPFLTSRSSRHGRQNLTQAEALLYWGSDLPFLVAPHPHTPKVGPLVSAYNQGHGNTKKLSHCLGVAQMDTHKPA